MAVPPGDDCDSIVKGVANAAPKGLDFKLRAKGDPSESSDIELCFRIRGVEQPEEAVARALEIYEVGREAAGLKPDTRASATLNN